MHHNRMPRPDDHKRMTIFFLLAALIMGLSYVFITKPHLDQMRVEQAIDKQRSVAVVESDAGKLLGIDEALASEGKRVTLENDIVRGSFALTGLRFDDVQLKDYYVTLDKTEHVRLLSPAETKISYFVEIGVLPSDKSIHAPGNDTHWTIVSGDKLTPDMPLVMEWDNGQGVVYRRTVTLDQRYVTTVLQSIINKTDQVLTFYPYALVSQSHHIPAKGEKVSFEDRDANVQHVGPIAYLNGELQEESYKAVRNDHSMQYPNSKGWLGITSKYWLVSLLPENDQTFDARFSHQQGEMKQDIYQVDMRLQPVIVEANAQKDIPMRFFAGAKKLDILTDYEDQLNIPKFDLSVDFGVLYIITKPLYHFLTYIGSYYREELHLTVSFGLALLTLTVLMRLLTFPLQNKAYRSMNRMKDLAPKMHALKEKHGDDKAKFQQEVLALYKREKINPASGCLPILIQIPIFFALYKVIYITLDMRHAPFFGWIHDLSAPDPTNVWNLFGLLSYNTPEFMTIGAWPLLYGMTMYLQQKLNPKPEDATQQQIFAALPWVFTFIFAKFPAGLVIYYTWSNLLGIVQQYSVRKINPATKKEPA